MARDIQIVQVDPETGVISLSSGAVPTFATGLPLLVQVVSLAYLSDPGHDAYDPTQGSGVRQTIGQIAVNNELDLQADFIARTNKIESEILANQSGLQIDPTEMLQSLTILGIAVDVANSEVNPTVQITNQAGQSQVVSL